MGDKRPTNWVIVGLCVFCNAVCAGLWLYRGLFWGQGVDWFYVTIGAIWAMVALVWCIQMIRRPRKDKKKLKDPKE